MVQIIQSGPSQATLRQQALNDALSSAISGYAAYQDKQEKKALTDRQKALDTFSNVLKLREAGYDVNAQDLESAIAKPESIADIFSKRTEEFKSRQLGEQTKRANEEREFNQRMKKSEAEIAALEANAGIDSERKKLEIQKIKEDLLMSPIARRKAAAEAGKLEKEVKTTTAPQNKLSKLGAESQNKIGGIVSALDSLKAMGGAITEGYGPRIISPDTALIGGFVSDDPYSAEERVVTEVIGRLQSGGAISADEGERFKALGPRPGDNQEQVAKKLDAQRRFLENKVIALGIKPEELDSLGFNTRFKLSGDSAPKNPTAMSREEKIKFLQGGI